MSSKEMLKKLDPTKNFVLFASGVIAVGAARHLYQLNLVLREIEQAAPFLSVTFLAWLQILLLLSLLMVAAGLIVRRRMGLLCSIVGLVGVLLGYLGWFDYTHRYLQLLAQNPFYLEHPELVPPNSFRLIGGSWLDIVLLILFVALLVLEIKWLVRPAPKRSLGES
jgi:hypothetical protein